MTFFTFMHANWWILFLLGIPAQLIVLLSFKKPKPELRADEKPSDMPE
jgi:type II secretory pathway component PulF